MSITYSYTYTILRYVHDTTTGEFVNVGIALYAPDARYCSAICLKKSKRLTKVFPGIDGKSYNSLMNYIQNGFEKLGQQVRDELLLKKYESVIDIAKSILPIDDSSLQWSKVGGGITENPDKELEKLYDRMVIHHEDHQQHRARSDDEVWRYFKRELEQRQLLKIFQPKLIVVKDDEKEFQHAWKNTIWHCVEPISFDLSGAEGIRDKVHKYFGQLASIHKDTEEEFKLYLLVGKPQKEDLLPEFDKAISILRKMPVETEIFREEEVQEFSNMIEHEVTLHSLH